MDVRMLIVYSLLLAAATCGDVPSYFMDARSSRRYYTRAEGFAAAGCSVLTSLGMYLPGTQLMYDFF